MANTFIKYPKTGDVAIGVIASGEKKFIAYEDFSLAGLDTSLYEVLGGVMYREGRKVTIAAPDETSKTWIGYYDWTLSGYVLDGTDRTFVLEYRDKSNSWGSNLKATITYNATDATSLVASIEASLQDVENLVAQDWHCYIKDGAVKLTCKYEDYRQPVYNKASNGATITASLLPELTACSDMLRINGQYAIEGALYNLDRALIYFRQDNNSTSYNPTTFPANLRRSYPICLPCYLGTSAYNSPSVEKCAALRAKYGEGEEGWINYMKSCMAYLHTDRGAAKEIDGLAQTKLISKDLDFYGNINSPAVSYVSNYEKQTIAKGEWYLGTPRELAKIFRIVRYPVASDPINNTMKAIGGSYIANGADAWSCGRFSASYAWCANGSGGFFHGYVMYFSFRVRPLAQIYIED